MRSVVAAVTSFVRDINPKFLTTLKYKFKKPEYNEVANLPFNF